MNSMEKLPMGGKDQIKVSWYQYPDPFLANVPIIYSPWKLQKTFGFLVFSGVIKWKHWSEIGESSSSFDAKFEKNNAAVMFSEVAEVRFPVSAKFSFEIIKFYLWRTNHIARKIDFVQNIRHKLHWKHSHGLEWLCPITVSFAKN